MYGYVGSSHQCSRIIKQMGYRCHVISQTFRPVHNCSHHLFPICFSRVWDVVDSNTRRGWVACLQFGIDVLGWSISRLDQCPPKMSNSPNQAVLTHLDRRITAAQHCGNCNSIGCRVLYANPRCPLIHLREKLHALMGRKSLRWPRQAPPEYPALFTGLLRGLWLAKGITNTTMSSMYSAWKKGLQRWELLENSGAIKQNELSWTLRKIPTFMWSASKAFWMVCFADTFHACKVHRWRASFFRC